MQYLQAAKVEKLRIWNERCLLEAWYPLTGMLKLVHDNEVSLIISSDLNPNLVQQIIMLEGYW